MKPVTLTIAPENAEQKVADGWAYARQRDFTGGESLAKLPESVARNQLVRMENAIISPEGQITESWQMDKPLFINVTTGIVVVPIPGSKLFTVYAAAGEYVVSFTFDPNSETPYDLADASGYPGYRLLSHAAPVTISGITHGTPFLGKDFCCAVTSLIIAGGELISNHESVDFGTVQTRTINLVSLTITNTTAGTVTLSGISLTGTGSGAFGHSGAFPQPLAAGETYTFNVVFNPTSPVASAAALNVISTIGTLIIPLSGTAESMLSALPASINFGTVRDGSTTVRVVDISNSGGTAAAVISVEVDGDGAVMLSSTPALPYRAPIPAGGSLGVSVSLDATTLGDISALAKVQTDLGDVTIPIIGNVAPMPVLTPQEPFFSYPLPGSALAMCMLTLTYDGTGSINLVSVSAPLVSAILVNEASSSPGPYGPPLALPHTVMSGKAVYLSFYSNGMAEVNAVIVTDVKTFNVKIKRAF